MLEERLLSELRMDTGSAPTVESRIMGKKMSRTKLASRPGPPPLDPREDGEGPSPKLVFAVSRATKRRVMAVAQARDEDNYSDMCREAIDEKLAKEERRLKI